MRNYSDSPLQISVTGQVIGEIWMPCTYCSQHFTINITRERERFTDKSLSINEAICRHTSYDCGDFQSCAIAEATLHISYRVGNKTISKSFDLEKSECLKDEWANEFGMQEFYQIDSDY